MIFSLFACFLSFSLFYPVLTARVASADAAAAVVASAVLSAIEMDDAFCLSPFPFLSLLFSLFQ